MTSNNHIFGLVFATTLVLVAPKVLAEEEVLIGRNTAGQLIVHVEYEQPFQLEKSVFPDLTGYATGELGFHSNFLDQPADDFYLLSEAADFRMVLVAKDTGIEVLNDHGSGFMTIGEMFEIGAAPFDTHPVWNIVSGTPGHIYGLTLKLHDANSVYPDSSPFVLSFTPLQTYYQLNLAKAGAGQVALTWPTNATGWLLQTCTSLSTANWAAVTNLPGITGTNFSLNLFTVEKQQFFRLYQP